MKIIENAGRYILLLGVLLGCFLVLFSVYPLLDSQSRSMESANVREHEVVEIVEDHVAYQVKLKEVATSKTLTAKFLKNCELQVVKGGSVPLKVITWKEQKTGNLVESVQTQKLCK